jgi:5-methyltetrahydropteroyltriglutamate--homocysteine methyltransferase
MSLSQFNKVFTLALLNNGIEKMKAHVLGFPRIGVNSELKKSLEDYWSGVIDQSALEQTGQQLRQRHWQAQQTASLDFVTVGDFVMMIS